MQPLVDHFSDMCKDIWELLLQYKQLEVAAKHEGTIPFLLAGLFVNIKTLFISIYFLTIY